MDVGWTSKAQRRLPHTQKDTTPKVRASYNASNMPAFCDGGDDGGGDGDGVWWCGTYTQNIQQYI